MHQYLSYFLRAGLLCLVLLASAAWGRAAAPPPSPEEELAELINAERWSNGGLFPLKVVGELDTAAESHSTNMAERNFVMHCDPDTGTLSWDRMAAAGYTGFTYAAENIAAGYSTPQAVVAAWMSSDGHRANILSPNYREFGHGYVLQANDQANVRLDNNGDCVPDSNANGPYCHYWTQDFGQRPDIYPLVVEREAHATASLQIALYIYAPANANQMRFSNDGTTWSEWQPHSTDVTWDLSVGNGQKTVYGQVSAGGTTYSAQDSIWLDASPSVAPDVDIAQANPGVELAWRHTTANWLYEIYRSATQPHFAPSAGDAELIGTEPAPPADDDTVTFTDSAAATDASYYLVRAIAGDGITPADSNRVGRFDYAMALP